MIAGTVHLGTGHVKKLDIGGLAPVSIQTMWKEGILLILKESKEYDKDASIHDFRMVHEDDQMNLVFDLVVAYSYSKGEKEKLIQKVEEAVVKKDKRYHCVITIEHSYIRNH